jgi:hypothetical protein
LTLIDIIGPGEKRMTGRLVSPGVVGGDTNSRYNALNFDGKAYFGWPGVEVRDDTETWLPSSLTNQVFLNVRDSANVIVTQQPRPLRRDVLWHFMDVHADESTSVRVEVIDSKTGEQRLNKEVISRRPLFPPFETRLAKVLRQAEAAAGLPKDPVKIGKKVLSLNQTT